MLVTILIECMRSCCAEEIPPLSYVRVACLNNKKEIIWRDRQEKIPLVHTIPDLLLAKAHPLYLRFYDLTEIQPS